MTSSQAPGQESDPSIQTFLAQPAYHADEDASPEPLAPLNSDAAAGSVWRRARTHLNRFMFEKKSSPYSSIAPRTANDQRTKIFFFNGNGRGR